MTENSPIKPEWISSVDVREQYGISEKGLRYWRKELNLKNETVGRVTYYLREEIETRLKPKIESKHPARTGRPRKGKGSE
jgi:hypothetical protein